MTKSTPFSQHAKRKARSCGNFFHCGRNVPGQVQLGEGRPAARGCHFASAILLRDDGGTVSAASEAAGATQRGVIHVRAPGIQTHRCSKRENGKTRYVTPRRFQRIGESAWIFKLLVFLPFFLSRTEGSSARRNVRDRAACTCSCRAVRSTTSPTAPSYDLFQALPCSISWTL